ncbi:MAG: hypothetical protein JST85_28690 [Acidobacteria bacterium]|nr:hypothetical protein [Acidobacteriota bacterium]
MKKMLAIPTLVFLFALSTVAAIPQQPISPEKKSALHNLDPVDIFPQAQERNGKNRNRNSRYSKKVSETVATELASNSSESSHSRSGRKSRRHRSSEQSAPTGLAENSLTAPSTTTTPQLNPPASPVATPDEGASLAESPGKPSAQPQTLASMSNLPEAGTNSQHTLLSLPIILALLVIVLIALVLVFAKLVRHLRGPAV